jgi:hypothetical protein
MIKFPKLALSVSLGVVTIFGAVSMKPAIAASLTFDWWTTSGDSTTIDDITVTLDTVGVERFESTATRDIPGNSDGGFYLFTFDKAISSFKANLSRFAPYEVVTDFSIAPSSVNGVLIASGSPITSVGSTAPDDHGVGSIMWTGLNTTTIGFTLDPNLDPPGPDPERSAIAFNSFEFTLPDEPPVSVPEPLTILGSVTALGFGALLKREHSKKRKKS